ncbi:MAG: leucine-rich repeat domain-containing protein [Clostridia bacterium]|nr:leucine-rich repeat domain-containing protein [Clostridia bacterium]
MKKLLCVLLALLLALSFAACSKGKDADDDLSKYLQDEEVIEKIKLENGDVFYLESVDTVTLIVTGYESSHELHELTIPDTLAGKKVIGIGPQAFYYCNSLTSVTIPDTVISIGNYAFAACSFLETVTIPASVKTLGTGAFCRCEKLSSLTFSEGGALEEIPEACFWDCAALTQVTIPSYINLIGKGAFYGCTELATLVVEDSETPVEIRDQAFQNLPKLVNVTLPENATFAPLSFAGTPFVEE